MKKLFYSLMASTHLPRTLRNLKTLEMRLVSPQTRLAIPFVLKGHGLFKSIKPRQNPYEIEEMFERICALKPKRVLEIGTMRGGSLYLWAQAAADDAIIVSVDLPGGDFGGGYPEQRTELYKAFARPNQTMHLLRSDSHQPESLEKVAAIFGDEPIDFAFIDGDHTYEGVKADFEMYGKLVRPGGLIGLHDTQTHPDLDTIQVDRFWKDIKDNYESVEFVGEPTEEIRTVGIGLIRVPEGGI